MKNSLVYFCSLFILMMSLTTFNLTAAGQHEKECPEGQVFDTELGACIAEDTSDQENGEEDSDTMQEDVE